MIQSALVVLSKAGLAAYQNIDSQMSQQMPTGCYKLPAFQNSNQTTNSKKQQSLEKVCSTTSKNGSMFMCSTDAPIIYQYCQSKEQNIGKSFYAGSQSEDVGLISAMLIHEQYLIAGTSKGMLFVWNQVTGCLMRKVRAHFAAVSCMAVMNDEFLVTCGSDGDSVVHMWLLSQIETILDSKFIANAGLNSQKLQESLQFTPLASHNEHSAAIMQAQQMGDRLLTCSADKTCKLWTVVCRPGGDKNFVGPKWELKCLLTILYKTSILSAIVDFAESIIIAGGADGQIYLFSLLAEQSDSLDSAETYQLVHFVDPLENERQQQLGTGKFVMRGHDAAVTAMTLGVPQSTVLKVQQKLYSGDASGVVNIWDLDSRQLLHTINYFKSGQMGQIYNLSVRHAPQLFVKPLRGKQIYSGATRNNVQTDAVVLLDRNVAPSLDAARQQLDFLCRLDDNRIDNEQCNIQLQGVEEIINDLMGTFAPSVQHNDAIVALKDEIDRLKKSNAILYAKVMQQM